MSYITYTVKVWTKVEWGRIIKMSVVYDYEHEKQKYLIMVEFRKTQIDLLRDYLRLLKCITWQYFFANRGGKKWRYLRQNKGSKSECIQAFNKQ